MAIPNGVTPNGSQSAGSDDISKLTEILLSIESSIKSISGNSDDDAKDKKRSKAMQVSRNTTVNDMIKFTNNLGLAVPAGFIMIHNDLEKLLSSGSGGGGGLYAALAAAAGAAITGALTAAGDAGAKLLTAGGDAVATGAKGIGEGISTAASGVGDAAVNVIEALKKTGDKGIDTLLSDEEFANQLKGDGDVFKLRKMAIMAYLRSYYANLIEPAGYSVEINSDDWKLTKDTSLASVVDDFAQGFGNLVGNTVGSVMNAVQQGIENGGLNDDAEVQRIRAMGYTAYLRAYYANLIQPNGYVVEDVNANTWTLVSDISIASVGDDIGQALGGLVSGPVNALMGSITDSIANVSQNFKEEVDRVRAFGYANYLRAYYANLMEPMGYAPEDINAKEWTLVPKTSAASVGDDIGQFLGGIVSGPVDAIMGSITSSIANIVESFKPEVDRVRAFGYANYLKAYYANMIEPLGYAPEDINAETWVLVPKTSAASVGDDIGQFLGGIVAGPINAVGEAVTNTIANVVESFKPEVDRVRAYGYMAYLKAYYANMIKPMGVQVDDMNADPAEWKLHKEGSAEAIIKIITDTLGGIMAAPVKAIGQALTDTVADAAQNSDPLVQKTRAAGYRAYVRAYYLNMLESYGYTVDIDKLNRDDFTIRKGGLGEGLIKGWINDATSTVGKAVGNVLGGAMSGLQDLNIIDESLNNDPGVKYTRTEGYKSVLNVMFNKMSEAMDDIPKGVGSDARNYAKKALESAFDALGKRTSEQIQENTTVISSTYDDTRMRLLVNDLLTKVKDMRDKMDVIIEKDPVVFPVGQANTAAADFNLNNEIAE